jgi:galactokinase
LANYDPYFKSTSFPLLPPSTSDSHEWHVDFTSPADGGGWENYLKVSFAECLAEYFKGGRSRRGEKPRGMDLMMCGNVPPGSGLSVSPPSKFFQVDIVTQRGESILDTDE